MIMRQKAFSPWTWVPTLYFVEGLPNVIVVSMSVLLYKNMGVSNTATAFFTSLIYLAWVVKPLWSPFVDIFGTKRRWIINMQLAMAVALALTGAFMLTPMYFAPSLIFLGLLAFLSATHDIAADGFYMLGLSEHRQSYFVGVRSVFYKLATVAASAGAPWISGRLIAMGMTPGAAWAIVFGIIALLFLGAGSYHARVLPHPAADHGKPDRSAGMVMKEFAGSLKTFFLKPHILPALLFMSFYRLPEALLVKMIPIYLTDEGTGLGLTNEQYGTVYGIIGVIGLLLGGLVGGWLISRGGLRKWLMPMAVGMSLSCGAFVVLCHASQPSMLLINAMVFVEQLGYGFGFSAYMLYLIYFARGAFATSHYAIATGFMAAGLMLPGMAAGLLQNVLGGYPEFFNFTMICCVTTIAVSMAVLRYIDPHFGRKNR